ncbi:UNVERIFIED_ORG: hypothetical protein J2Y78_004828 [Buttiauxella agrestis ATCC 33320]
MNYTLNAPYGVTAIQLDNGNEDLYLHGDEALYLMVSALTLPIFI